MLGQLLEFAVHAPRTVATLELYQALGFQSLPVAEIPGAPFAAMSDGRATIGLHDAEIDGIMPTFARPDLEAHARALQRLGIELELEELGADQFNRIAFRDPNGCLVTLVEARTFSPAPRASAHVCAFGAFSEWSVATSSVEESEAFWTSLGFTRTAASESSHRSIQLAGHGLVAGFHEVGARANGLTYSAPNLAARIEYLAAKHVRVARSAPFAPLGSEAATVVMPAKTVVYLQEPETS
jgi:catechol 2,3-dioxygenase-like lactoylglutathione lyase family enzyme